MCHQLDSWVQNLFGFGGHFPFFLGKSIIKEHINMRNGVKGNLLGKNFWLHRIIDVNGTGLIEQFIHRWLASTRYRLIGRHHHPAHTKSVVKRLQRHHKLGG